MMLKDKPHLYSVYGIWHCHLPCTRTGLGYTPVKAYQDWRAMQIRELA